MLDPKSTEKLVDEAAKVLPEFYKDGFQPMVREVGQVAGRSTKALLSPLRGFLWGWERIEKLVEEGVTKRLEKVPEENKKTPEPEIAVPLMQALTYTAQNETLREMYLNLLANSMNTKKEKDVHPSFVELIKQMNTLDAKVFDKLSDIYGYIQIINPYISVKGSDKHFVGATPQWFLDLEIPNYDMFDVSSSFVRLSKFGLIDLLIDRTAGKDNYEQLIAHPHLVDILTKYQQAKPDLELELTKTDSLIHVNEYGLQFKNACTNTE